MNKNGAILLFMGSIGFIIIAIVFSAIIDRPSQSNSQDIRARAATEGYMEFLGVAGAYDPATNILVVNNLKFADTQGADLGTWNVTPPGGFNAANFPTGSNIKISGISASFQVEGHTLEARSIDKH